MHQLVLSRVMSWYVSHAHLDVLSLIASVSQIDTNLVVDQTFTVYGPLLAQNTLAVAGAFSVASGSASSFGGNVSVCLFV